VRHAADEDFEAKIAHWRSVYRITLPYDTPSDFSSPSYFTGRYEFSRRQDWARGMTPSFFATERQP
jgi:hypothetical protein